MTDITERAKAEAERRILGGSDFARDMREQAVAVATFAATITAEQVEAGRAAVAEFMACGHCDGSCGDCTGTVLAVVRAMGFEVAE